MHVRTLPVITSEPLVDPSPSVNDVARSSLDTEIRRGVSSKILDMTSSLHSHTKGKTREWDDYHCERFPKYRSRASALRI